MNAIQDGLVLNEPCEQRAGRGSGGGKDTSRSEAASVGIEAFQTEELSTDRVFTLWVDERHREGLAVMMQRGGGLGGGGIHAVRALEPRSKRRGETGAAGHEKNVGFMKQ